MFLPYSRRTVRENVMNTLYLPGAKLSLAPLPTSRQSRTPVRIQTSTLTARTPPIKQHNPKSIPLETLVLVKRQRNAKR
jgi:hypothetical protein